MFQWTLLGYITILTLWCGSVDSTGLHYNISFNCSYAKGFVVVFDMRQCKITLDMSPPLYQKEEEEGNVT
jgi:hypothetical protein